MRSKFGLRARFVSHPLSDAITSEASTKADYKAFLLIIHRHLHCRRCDGSTAQWAFPGLMLAQSHREDFRKGEGTIPWNESRDRHQVEYIKQGGNDVQHQRERAGL